MNILTCNHVSFHFNNESKLILQDINYQIKAEDFIILLGSNGSGKSTLLKLFQQHYQPKSGEIYFLEKNLTGLTDKKHAVKRANAQNQVVHQHIAMLTQNYADSLFTSLTVYENFLIRKTKLNKQDLANYLAEFNVNLSYKLGSTAAQLSGGEKQALALALCLFDPPKLLLLDEHTSALDPKTSAQIMQLTHEMIVRRNITCVLTTHDLEIALKYGNRVLMLRNGSIYKNLDEHEKKLLTKESLGSMYY